MDRVIIVKPGFSLISHSEEETQEMGKNLGHTLPKNSILALFGEVGCGKTTLVKGLAQSATGCFSGAIHSPTFNLLNIYKGAKPVFHFDLYRLKDPEEFFKMGFDEYFSAGGITCIEWAERIASKLPLETHRLVMAHLEQNKREITFQS